MTVTVSVSLRRKIGNLRIEELRYMKWLINMGFKFDVGESDWHTCPYCTQSDSLTHLTRCISEGKVKGYEAAKLMILEHLKNNHNISRFELNLQGKLE